MQVHDKYIMQYTMYSKGLLSPRSSPPPSSLPLQGLPSALLAVTSFCDTGLDDTGLPGGSLSSHSSLASSLTELAGALGSKPTEAGEEAVTRNGAPETESNARASQSGAVYNPFDSDGMSTHLSSFDTLNTGTPLPSSYCRQCQRWELRTA